MNKKNNPKKSRLEESKQTPNPEKSVQYKDKDKDDDIMGSAMETVMNVMVTVIALSIFLPKMPMFQSAQRYFDSQTYQGQSESHILSATDVQKHIVLNNPWIGAYFINDGPDTVMIRINDESSTPFLLGFYETITLSRSGADTRIYAIYYQCNSGETTSVRVLGVH